MAFSTIGTGPNSFGGQHLRNPASGSVAPPPFTAGQAQAGQSSSPQPPIAGAPSILSNMQAPTGGPSSFAGLQVDGQAQAPAPEAALKPLQSLSTGRRMSEGPFGSTGFSGFGLSSRNGQRTDTVQNLGSFGLTNPALQGFGSQAQALSGQSTGANGGNGNYSIDRAFQKTEANQNFVQDLLLNGGQFASQYTGNPIGQNIQQAALNPTGLGADNLAALQRQSTDTISGAADQAVLDARNQLAARGFTDSAVAPRMESDIRQGAARDVQSAMESIALQDSLQAQQNQQASINQYLQLLQQQQQAQQGAAGTIAGFQYPFVQDGSGSSPQAALGGGTASGGVGGGVTSGGYGAGGKVVGSNGQLTQMPSNFDEFGNVRRIGDFTQEQYGSLGANILRQMNEQRAQLNATPDNPYQLIRF